MAEVSHTSDICLHRSYMSMQDSSILQLLKTTEQFCSMFDRCINSRVFYSPVSQGSTTILAKSCFDMRPSQYLGSIVSTLIFQFPQLLCPVGKYLHSW